MSRKILKALALMAWVFLIGVVFILVMQSGQAAAAPPFQQPEEEPAVFPEPPAPDSEIGAQSQVGASATVVSPTINYQGYLADSSGEPVSGTVTITANLYYQMSGGSAAWGETHTGVQVEDGLFSIVLGQNNALTPGNFSSQLYLGLEVDGVTLPRQKLRTVPYAFSLVPGTFVQGDSVLPIVTFSNSGENAAVYAFETSPTKHYGLKADRIYSQEGYASDADTYLWVSGNEAVESDTYISLTYGVDGTVEVYCNFASTPSSAPENVYIPISLPGVLYGHNVVVKEMRVEYYTTNSATFIGETRLEKAEGTGYSDILIQDFSTRDSTFSTYYDMTVSATSNYTLTEFSGPLNFTAQISCGNGGDSIYLGGVRLRLGHPRTDL